VPASDPRDSLELVLRFLERLINRACASKTALARHTVFVVVLLGTAFAGLCSLTLILTHSTMPGLIAGALSTSAGGTALAVSRQRRK
jgi:hypothetical protein